MPVNVDFAQRFVCLLARKRERIEVRETGMASFIIGSGYLPCPLEQCIAQDILEPITGQPSFEL